MVGIPVHQRLKPYLHCWRWNPLEIQRDLVFGRNSYDYWLVNLATVVCKKLIFRQASVRGRPFIN